ncbi:KIF9 [Branchiostoma lanceolatum]|uniref:Kinesin-like protein KIF9 n=1 Tax=Branchiostoma lanceolatum TaxID=7740 RepID=A0A8J9ZAP2_BRALA|nr:KIF9 [Branchiostoma lanceolatum]
MSATRGKRVRCFVRTRPTPYFAKELIKFHDDKKTVTARIPKDDRRGVVNNQQLEWQFKMDGILHNSSQDQVFDEVASDMVTSTLDGYNGTLMCYGQTGAGKTFSITGATEGFYQRGIIPRAIAQTFREVDERVEQAITVRISYLEIYNEGMFDLLSTLPETAADMSPMAIVEDENGVSVKGLSLHVAHNEEEALNLLFEGETNRAIAMHSLNKNSSRSHCIFTIHVESRSRTQSKAAYTVSKLNFVDLAGSERLKKTGSSGNVQREAMYINKSLTFLEQAIIALADKNREHVPYRQSKLTHALKDSIGGNCKTILIANIWGEATQIEETISTLRFASRMMCISNEPSINTRYDPVLMVKQLEHEIRHLKQELAMHDTLSNRAKVSYDPLAESQLIELQRQVHLYLNDNLDEIEIVNIRQVKEVFAMFKGAVKNMEGTMEARLREKYTLLEKGEGVGVGLQEGVGGDGKGGQVGELDGQGFGVGVAPPSSKMANAPIIAAKKPKAKKGKERASPTGPKGVASPTPSTRETPQEDISTGKLPTGETVSLNATPATPHAPATRPTTPPPRTEAFEEFKKEKGSEIYRILSENKEILVNKKTLCKKLAQSVNETKQEIDKTRLIIERKRNERLEQGEFVDEEGETIIDEDEYELLMKLKDLKAGYRRDYDELRAVKQEVQYCQRLVEQCRQRLIQEFDAWYSESFLAVDDPISSTMEGIGIRAGTMIRSRAPLEDEQEKFERLQQDLLDPDAAPFYNAKVRTEWRQTTNAAQRQPASFRKP